MEGKKKYQTNFTYWKEKKYYKLFSFPKTGGSNFRTEVHIDKNLKKSLKYANKIKADYAIILGEEEVKKEVYTVKNLNTGFQNTIEKKFILEFFKNDWRKWQGYFSLFKAGR